MKAKIATTIPIKQAWLDEVKEYIPTIEFEVVETDTKLQVWYNSHLKSMYGVFDHLRQIVNAPTGYRYRVYVMSNTERMALGIKDHYAAYDSRDRDGVLDFYMGVPDRIQDKTKLNGFRSNFARVFVHECLHGKEQEIGREYLAVNNPDRTHEWEARGELPSLIKEHFVIKDLKVKITLWQQIYELTKTLVGLKKKSNDRLQPLVERKANEVVRIMAALGHPVRIVEGYRTKERQEELYAQGRTTPGSIVTNARGGESLHNYGVAVDFVFRRDGYNAPEELWLTLAAVGTMQGFEWGGSDRWRKAGFVDLPHFELRLGYSLSDFQRGKVDYSKYQ